MYRLDGLHRLYRLSIRAKQNYKSGSFSTRSVWIDNKLPFEEAANIKFRFNNQWQMVTAQMENGDPYLFYLSEGEHTIRLEVALGDHSELLRLVEDSVNELSGIYRKVIMLTGSMPDSLRDYKLKKNLPEIFTSMEDQIKTLNQVNDYLVKLSGKKGEESATIDKLLVLLKLFQEKEAQIYKEDGKKILSGKIKLSYAINKNTNLLLNALKPYEDTRKELMEEYRDLEQEEKAIEQEKRAPGNVDIILKEGKSVKELNQKIQELLGLEMDFEVHKVSLEEFDGLDIGSWELGIFMFMIED